MLQHFEKVSIIMIYFLQGLSTCSLLGPSKCLITSTFYATHFYTSIFYPHDDHLAIRPGLCLWSRENLVGENPLRDDPVFLTCSNCGCLCHISQAQTPNRNTRHLPLTLLNVKTTSKRSYKDKQGFSRGHPSNCECCLKLRRSPEMQSRHSAIKARRFL